MYVCVHDVCDIYEYTVCMHVMMCVICDVCILCVYMYVVCILCVYVCCVCVHECDIHDMSTLCVCM